MCVIFPRVAPGPIFCDSPHGLLLPCVLLQQAEKLMNPIGQAGISLRLNVVPRGRTVLLLSILGLLSLLTDGWAHDCGPPVITVKVGEACPWRILADRHETSSFYFPVLTGEPGVASINPTLPFQAHHGDLVIRGLKPGTNVLVVNWFYPGTGAASVCPLTIQVVAPAAGETSFQTSEGNGQLCTAEDQKYIESRSLRQMLDFYVPRATPKLLILNQCFAGNVAASVFFRDLTNTAIATGNSPNQEAH